MTRVDPELYGDSPIFRQMLRERKGRWPGIPQGELPPAPSFPAVTPLAEAPQVPPVMSRVVPLPPPAQSRTRPYVAPLFPADEFDPERTVSMPHAAEG